jgi:hypothetical protein
MRVQRGLPRGPPGVDADTKGYGSRATEFGGSCYSITFSRFVMLKHNLLAFSQRQGRIAAIPFDLILWCALGLNPYT